MNDKQRRYVDDIVDAMQTLGFTADAVARDLGVLPASVARRLHRYGEHDLARPFEVAARHRHTP